MYNLFSERNSVRHATLKKPIVRHYSNSSILDTEPLMDEVIEGFCTQLDNRFVASGQSCPLDEWLKHFKLPGVFVSKRKEKMTRLTRFIAVSLKIHGTS